MAEDKGRCPTCGRPIAAALPRCVYCGETLPASQDRPPTVEPSSPETDGTLIVVDILANQEALETALGLTPADAARRRRRDRYQMHRILAVEAAEGEARRLAEAGLGVVLLPQREVRSAMRPRIARSGEPEAGTFQVEAQAEPVRVVPEDLLLIVAGAVRRERAHQDPVPFRPKRFVGSQWVDERPIFHLHLRSDTRPIELEPWRFEFTDGRGGLESSVLRIERALESLAGGLAEDRSFDLETPALGASEEGPQGPLSMLGGLRDQARPRDAPKRPSVFLDNLAQFRFHSAWRGALARRRAG